jgi:hypothetical protein
MHRTDTPAVVLPETRIPSIRRVRPGRSLAWLAAGWAYFLRMTAPSAILSITLLGVALLVAVLTSARVGSILLPAWAIIYLGIVSTYCRKLDQHDELPCDTTHIYRSAPLWILGAIAGVVALALNLLSDAMGVSAISSSWFAGGHFGLLGLYFVAVKSLTLLAFMAFWMAPALIIFNGAGPLQAIYLSLLGSLKNFVPGLAFLVPAYVFLILAILPLGLGLIAVMPIVACGAYKAFEEIFD